MERSSGEKGCVAKRMRPLRNESSFAIPVGDVTPKGISAIYLNIQHFIWIEVKFNKPDAVSDPCRSFKSHAASLNNKESAES